LVVKVKAMFSHKLGNEEEKEGFTVSIRFLALLFLGIVLVVAGIIVLVVASLETGGSGSVGVVIFLGPFPIVFGSGPDSKWLILIEIIIAATSLVAFLVVNKRYGRLSE
jgi:uncharacterized membrane protein